jgi:hypothetical protein
LRRSFVIALALALALIAGALELASAHERPTLRITASCPDCRPRLGPSVTLGPLTKRVGCRVRGALPDAGCTPGARFEYATKTKVCRSGYARAVRNVSQATKDAVYRAYGMSRHFNGRNGEVDHLVSLELGGSNARSNLFPEAANPTPGAHEKDRLEDYLSRLVCRERISLRLAQRMIATDWLHARRWVNEHFPNG